MEEWLAAEIYYKGAVGISAQHLLKRDLVDHAGIIKATLAVGEGDCAAAFQPRGDFRDAFRVGDQSGRREHHIVVHVLPFKGGQTAGSAGNIREGRTLGRYRQGRMLQNVDAVLRASHAVPYKPVVHEITSQRAL